MKKSNKIIITTLCDNTASRIDILAEWGLSFLVECDSQSILFDTGYSNTCIHNAKILGKDLSKVSKIVLSHGHVDHTGGLLEVLKSINYDIYTNKIKPVEIISHPDIWNEKYVLSAKKTVFAGMTTTPTLLANYGAILKPETSATRLSNNIITTGRIAMEADFEHLDKELQIKQNNKFILDQLEDDQALIIKTNKGLIVILGCAHRGVINTLLTAQKITNESRIYMVLGGTHLSFASSERIEKTIAALLQLQVQKIGVSHCTGFKAAAKMAAAFGDNFFFNTAGYSIEIDA